MNYAQAREKQLEDGTGQGVWAWTTMRDNRVHTSEPCSGPNCRHESAEEACKHFYDWSLEQAEEYSGDPDTQHKCQIPGCETFTSVCFGNRQMWLAFQLYALCDDHRNKAALSNVLQPFAGAISITHS